MLLRLKQKLTYRIMYEITNRNPLKFLQSLNLDDYLPTIISILYLYTRPKKRTTDKTIYMSEIVCALGNAVRSRYRLKKDSALAAKTGAFILYTFEEVGLLQVVLGKGPNGHNTYIVRVLDDDRIRRLWSDLPTKGIEKLPSIVPFEPWTSVTHTTGVKLIKTGSLDVLQYSTPENIPMVYEVLNRKMAVGWVINKSILQLQEWSLRNKSEAFKDIWEQLDPEARKTKIREASAITELANKFKDTPFYHLYSLDFRGRIYPCTTYLHEQSSDQARGLLLRKDSALLGKRGFFWLCVSIASTWGGDAGREDGLKTDKISLEERFKWVLDNEEILLSYAEKPKVHTGWMKADKPWQFIAACTELMRLRMYQWNLFIIEEVSSMNEAFETYDYPCQLEAFIDGSNNGSQHLAALSRDEITAPLVNLVPQKYPGDLYEYIALKVWNKIEILYKELSEDSIVLAERLTGNITELKKQIKVMELHSDSRATAINQLKLIRKEIDILEDIPAIVFWHKITNNKERRKIVKRNVMTLPYGGTAYGLGQQQIDDARKHGIDALLYLEHKWGAFMGREVYTICKKNLKRPMDLLDIFALAGKEAEKSKRFLEWIVPITNFKVVQHYVEGTVKKVWILYGPPKGDLKTSTKHYENEVQLNICFPEESQFSKRRQSQGASPNIIHSLDAAHLILTCYRAGFNVTTIHDSYGALLSDMDRLFKLVRETFVELHEKEVLNDLMKQMGIEVIVDKGWLNTRDVLKSEYCFI